MLMQVFWDEDIIFDPLNVQFVSNLNIIPSIKCAYAFYDT